MIAPPTRFGYGLFLVLLLGAGACPAASFPDPLTTPAPQVAKADASRLMAVSLAGDALVAVGPRGTVLRSVDRGGSWQQMPVSLSSDLVSVRFLSAKLGWITGHDGVVLHSADGGRSWTKQLDGLAAARLIHEGRAKEALPDGADAQQRIEEARRYVADGADKPLFDVLFTSEREGFAVGAFNLAFRTEDGGKTWSSLFDKTANPNAFHLYGLADSGDAVYLVGEQGLIGRWRADKGRFEALPSPYKGSFFGVLAKGATVLTYGMRGNAFVSRDAGNTWVKANTRTSASLTAGAVLADGRIVLVTQTGQLLLSTDAGMNFEPAAVAPAPMPVFGVAALDDKTLVLAGARGVRQAVIGRRAGLE